MALPASVELKKLVFKLVSVNIIEGEGSGDLQALQRKNTFEEAFELVKEKIQEQALTLPVPVELEKFAKLVMFVSADVIENEGSAEVSELSKEMVGAIIFRRRAMQRFSNLSWRRSEPARIARP